MDEKNTNANLEDIPLSADEKSAPMAQNLPKVISKSNSLRRFFKINKKTGDKTKDRETENRSESGDEDAAAGSSSNKKREKEEKQPKRFHLRLGGMSRFENVADSVETPSSSNAGNRATTSRMSLKSSLSSYWNNMFKRHQPLQNFSVKDVDKQMPNSKEDSEEELDDINTIETVHNLKISDDSSEMEHK